MAKKKTDKKRPGPTEGIGKTQFFHIVLSIDARAMRNPTGLHQRPEQKNRGMRIGTPGDPRFRCVLL